MGGVVGAGNGARWDAVTAQQQRLRLDWFPLYARDALNDMAMRVMSSAERGMYWCLLFSQWTEGGLPDEERQLQVLAMEPDRAAFDAAWVNLEPLFPTGSDGLRRNRRLEGVAKEQQSRARQRRTIAKGAATARWAGVAEQGAREQTAMAEWAKAEAWLADQAPAKRKAIKAKARKRVAQQQEGSVDDMGDATRTKLERAVAVTILREMGVLNDD